MSDVALAAETMTSALRRLGAAGAVAMNAMRIEGGVWFAEVENTPPMQILREADRAWHDAVAAYVAALLESTEQELQGP